MGKGTKKKYNKNQERYLVNIFVFVVTVGSHLSVGMLLISLSNS